MRIDISHNYPVNMFNLLTDNVAFVSVGNKMVKKMNNILTSYPLDQHVKLTYLSSSIDYYNDLFLFPRR